MFSFSHLWRQHELSDVDLSISSNTTDGDTILIPAHKAILSASPYFRAQMQRWMQQNDDASRADSRQDSSNSNSLGAAAGHVPADKRPKLTLKLDSQAGIAAADQLVAAEAVIAAMYSAGSLESLTDSQLLSMAITADMLQLEPSVQQAVDCLCRRDPVSSDVQQQFMGLPAWPPAILSLFPSMGESMPASFVAAAWVKNCVPPSSSWVGSACHGPDTSTADAPLRADMQKLLLNQYGNLDAVWIQPELLKEVLSLPLLAMELLLESDKIQVSSEDNVLCTAQAYADAQPVFAIAAAEMRLARLIRVPSLTKLWQSAAVLAQGQFFSRQVLSHVAPQLKQYMALTFTGPCTREEAKQAMTQPECSSWFLGDRQYSPLTDGVEVTWELPVSELKAASLWAFNQKQQVKLESGSSAWTPPLQGVRWGLYLQCTCDSAVQGVQLAVFALVMNLPPGMYVTSSYQCIISSPVGGLRGVRTRLATDGAGWRDFFGLGVMAGGWNEAAWAAKGLPTHGTLQLKLKVEPTA